MLPNSPVMLGMAVARMVESRAARKMLSTSPMVITMSLKPPGYSSRFVAAEGSAECACESEGSSTTVVMIFASEGTCSSIASGSPSPSQCRLRDMAGLGSSGLYVVRKYSLSTLELVSVDVDIDSRRNAQGGGSNKPARVYSYMYTKKKGDATFLFWRPTCMKGVKP